MIFPKNFESILKKATTCVCVCVCVCARALTCVCAPELVCLGGVCSHLPMKPACWAMAPERPGDPRVRVQREGSQASEEGRPAGRLRGTDTRRLRPPQVPTSGAPPRSRQPGRGAAVRHCGGHRSSGFLGQEHRHDEEKRLCSVPFKNQSSFTVNITHVKFLKSYNWDSSCAPVALSS